jgi:hypothetical protein
MATDEIRRCTNMVDAVSVVQNKLVTLHLAILGLADGAGGLSGRVLSIERVFDEALRELDEALELGCRLAQELERVAA